MLKRYHVNVIKIERNKSKKKEEIFVPNHTNLPNRMVRVVINKQICDGKTNLKQRTPP